MKIKAAVSGVSSNSTCAAGTASNINSNPTTPSTSLCLNDNDRAMVELLKFQSNEFLQRRISEQWTEVDAIRTGPHADAVNYKIEYIEITNTVLSIILRAITVFINIRLAYDYYRTDQSNYFAWTLTCIVVPMFITKLIYANMCYQDGKFSKGFIKALQTFWLVFLSSFLFRYWMSLVYSIKCKRAELRGDHEMQVRYFKRTVREESDVAFIRLFECFLEAAPQKILQISIVLGHIEKMTDIQIIAISSYFCSMAWCLAAYHRYNRYAQIDKNNINFQGLVLQLCWHFCISVSRTLCIAFVASLFPIWTVGACLIHAFLMGFVTFIVDSPKFACNGFLNFLFCLVLGIVYLFTYISVKDAPTRTKYLLYYAVCSLENISCVLLFMIFAPYGLVSLEYLFFPLCAVTIAFYYVGIVFMVIYYLYFHPKITARQSKRIVNHS